MSNKREFEGGGSLPCRIFEATVAYKSTTMIKRSTLHVSSAIILSTFALLFGSNVNSSRPNLSKLNNEISKSATPKQTPANLFDWYPPRANRHRELAASRQSSALVDGQQMTRELAQQVDTDLSRYAELPVPSDERISSQKFKSFFSDLNFKGPHSFSSLSKLRHQQTKYTGLGGSGEIQHLLPNGPPPFRPTMLMLSLSNHNLMLLDKFKKTLLFKKYYKSKIYNLFLQILQQLSSLLKKMAKEKVLAHKLKVITVHAVLSKLIHSKKNQFTQLKWPLVVLNPAFLRQMLSTPTFLVMLFHAIEVAYTSLPIKHFWLRPLVKMVAQRSPAEEERIWWYRKRFYDSINGLGSSEMEPNLRATHFHTRGKPALIAVPSIGKLMKHFESHNIGVDYAFGQQFKQPQAFSYHQTSKEHADESILSSAQEESFLANQLKHYNRHQQMDHSNQAQQQQWTGQMPSADQLMSQEEFEMMDPQDREYILHEARRRFEESKWTNEIIKQQSDMIDSLAQHNEMDDPGNAENRQGVDPLDAANSKEASDTTE